MTSLNIIGKVTSNLWYKVIQGAFGYVIYS